MVAPHRGCFTEDVGEWFRDSTASASGLVEVFGSESVSFDEVQQVGVDFGAGRLHEVEAETVSRVLVEVNDSKSRVEADSAEGEAGFSFKQGIEVVKDGVGRVDSTSPRCRLR